MTSSNFIKQCSGVSACFLWFGREMKLQEAIMCFPPHSCHLHMGSVNLSSSPGYSHKLGYKGLECSLVERNLGVLVNGQDLSQQGHPCPGGSGTAWEGRGLSCSAPLCSALGQPQPESWEQGWVLQNKKGITLFVCSGEGQPRWEEMEWSCIRASPD